MSNRYIVLDNDGNYSISKALPDCTDTLEVMDSDADSDAIMDLLSREGSMAGSLVWIKPWVLANSQVTVYEVRASAVSVENWEMVGIVDRSPRMGL